MGVHWIDNEYIEKNIKERFGQNCDSSIHGYEHWKRVENVGHMLCGSEGVDKMFVTLFSYFHDSCRVDDSVDTRHGQVAANYAKSLRGVCYDMGQEDFDLLYTSIYFHSHPMVTNNASVGVCWDSDRIDLVRVGLIPKIEYMSTKSAKKYLENTYGECCLL